VCSKPVRRQEEGLVEKKAVMRVKGEGEKNVRMGQVEVRVNGEGGKNNEVTKVWEVCHSQVLEEVIRRTNVEKKVEL
jgi:hypothetical protein